MKQLTLPNGSPHPKQLKDEIWLTNEPIESDLSQMLWKTKRIDKTAYDVNGNIVTGLKSVFVKRVELEESGFVIEN